MRFITFSFIVLLALPTAQAAAQNAQLIDAAKNEGGKVVIYDSLKLPSWER
ncbi:MAG TPA: hypothetical protein VLX11_14375 [Candidatus Acidoferrales bacterium]|nr:hypothetical protein [Candidatus Acidoferrales bacterium]